MFLRSRTLAASRRCAQMLACDWADQAGRLMDSTASICAWEDAGWRVKRNIERFAVSRENDDPRHGQFAAPRICWRPPGVSPCAPANCETLAGTCSAAS